MNEKYCSQCGEILVPGAKFCPGCGRTVGQQNQRPVYSNPQPAQQAPYRPPVQTPYQPPVQMPSQPPVMQTISKKEYRKTCTNEQYLKGLKSSAIALYILIVINAAVSVATSPAGLVDMAIYLALTLGMHLKKSKACAVGVLIYAIINVIIIVASSGSFGGYLWVIAGIGAVRAFAEADKEYEAIYGGK